MTQIELDLVLTPTPALAMAFAAEVQGDAGAVDGYRHSRLCTRRQRRRAMMPAGPNPKLTPDRLARKAIIYLRQSSERQVQQNLESQRLQ